MSHWLQFLLIFANSMRRLTPDLLTRRILLPERQFLDFTRRQASQHPRALLDV